MSAIPPLIPFQKTPAQEEKAPKPHPKVSSSQLPLSQDNRKQKASQEKMQEIPKIRVHAMPGGKKIYFSTIPAFKAWMLS